MSKRYEFPKFLSYDINQDDIDRSTPTCENCPHARGIKRKTGSNRVRVFGGRVSIEGKDDRYYYSAPSYTHKFEVARDTAGMAACSPGKATIVRLYRTVIAPVDPERKARVNTARNVRRAARAQGNTVDPYRTRTGTLDGLVTA